MIELVAHAGAWTWRMISAQGRTLVQGSTHPTRIAALDSAEEYHENFMGVAAGADARQGACI